MSLNRRRQTVLDGTGPPRTDRQPNSSDCNSCPVSRIVFFSFFVFFLTTPGTDVTLAIAKGCCWLLPPVTIIISQPTNHSKMRRDVVCGWCSDCWYENWYDCLLSVCPSGSKVSTKRIQKPIIIASMSAKQLPICGEGAWKAVRMLGWVDKHG